MLFRSGDDDVELAKSLLRDLAPFAVVDVPLEPLRADVVVELVRPVRGDRERADYGACKRLARRHGTVSEGRRTDERHVVKALVWLLGLRKYALARVVGADEGDRLHRLSESCNS